MPDYCTAILRMNTRGLIKHIPKRGQIMKAMLRSMFLNGTVLKRKRKLYYKESKRKLYYKECIGLW